MRGIYAAAFLERLVAQEAKAAGVQAMDLGLGFDLICGTSTGAIMGCAAAVGCPLGRAVDLYRRQGAAIFPHRIRGASSVIYRALNGRRFVRAGERALRAALADVFSEITIADLFEERGISLSVPAVDMATHRPWVFKRTPASGRRDDDYRLVDVCLASSAAPIFRSLGAVEKKGGGASARRVFADGGLWANNPVMVAMTDALAMAEDGQAVEIFSLGTCPRPEGEHVAGDDVHRSLLELLSPSKESYRSLWFSRKVVDSGGKWSDRFSEAVDVEKVESGILRLKWASERCALCSASATGDGR